MATRFERANAVRALAMDAVERAASGHPGAPMGMADVAEVLWREHLRHNPADPGWFDRDRFVLSNGHGSMLLYALLHLSGYELSLDDLKAFRQLHSRTPGHPEYGDTPGVETTTGPLGQGFANAVGMALAEKMLAARFNRPGHEIIDHRTWVFVGDGCLMEGVSHEAASFAGHQALGKLVAVYDDNGISIDGETAGWFTDDTPGRFRAYGWHVVPDVDGHDPDAVEAAIAAALAEPERPSLICCRTVIGFGSPSKAGTAAAHGAALGAEEVAAARERLGWGYRPFEIPEAIRAEWDAREIGAARQAQWEERLARYRQAHPEPAAELERRMRGDLPPGFAELIEGLIAREAAADDALATRQASNRCLDALGPALPELLGGSADLSGSNGTRWEGAEAVTPAHPDGRYVFYGVREFAMTAITNGLALHGGFIPYGGTFLTFMDYARNAVRLAALMGVGNVLVYTHDSLALGEDGPTHQPVEQLGTLRMTPRMVTWRPCDRGETAVAWRAAIERRDGPTALVLSRQKLPQQPRDAAQLAGAARGGYVLHDPEPADAARCIIVATGSEVALAMDAARQLDQEGRPVRVVSLPSVEVFRAQSESWRSRVLPPDLPRLVVEASHPLQWAGLAGDRGRVLGVEDFGVSAPGGEAMNAFGFSADRIARAARGLIDTTA